MKRGPFEITYVVREKETGAEAPAFDSRAAARAHIDFRMAARQDAAHWADVFQLVVECQ